MIGFVLTLGVALAADPDLVVERGHVLLEQERTAEALAFAREALAASPEDPDARALLVEASLAGGLGPWVLSVPPVEPGAGEIERIRAAARAGDDAGAVAALAALDLSERPDLLAPVLAIEPAGRKLAKARSKAVGAIDRELARGRDDVLWLYRVRRLRLATGRDPEPAAQALRVAGEPVPDPDAWTRFDLLEEGRRQAQTGSVALPEGVAPSRLAVLVEKMSTEALRARNGGLALAAWSALRERADGADAALGHAVVLLELKRFEEALAAADAALVRAVDPDPADLAVSMTDRRALQLATALHVRARALEGLVRLPEAAVDLLVADMLAGQSLDPELSKRLARGLILPDGPSPGVLLKRAPSGDPVPIASEALVRIAATGAGKVWRREVAEAHRLIAGALEGPPARVAWTIARMLDETPADHEALATLHEAAGHTEAAFRSCAALTVLAPGEEASACVGRTFTGLGSAEPVVEALTADLRATHAAPSEPEPTRGAGSAEPSPARSPQIRVGGPAPSWTLADARGGLSSDALLGRAVVLVFLEVACVDCLGMLYDFGSAARALRGQGRDVVVIGVAVDGEEAQGRFLQLQRAAEKWGTLYRSPEVAARFGVQDAPVAYLINHEGIVRGEVRRWLGRAHLERELRRVLQE